MGLGDYNIENMSGKKERLNDLSGATRLEQLSKKAQIIASIYDKNNNGTLELEELAGVFGDIKRVASLDSDKNTLSELESLLSNDEFATKFMKLAEAAFKDKDSAELAELKNLMGNANLDFYGFVKELSDLSVTIESTTNSTLPDGGKVLTTRYTDGVTEILGYYPDGRFKFKKTIREVSSSKYTLEINNNPLEITKEEFDNLMAKPELLNPENYKTTKITKPVDMGVSFMSSVNPKKVQELVNEVPALALRMATTFGINEIKLNSFTEKHPEQDVELSEDAAKDAYLRDFAITHYIENYKGTKQYLDDMGPVDYIAAALNDFSATEDKIEKKMVEDGNIAGALSLRMGINPLKGLYRMVFGTSATNQELRTFYFDLKEKFEQNYGKTLELDDFLKPAQDDKSIYFTDLERLFKEDFKTLETEKLESFHKATTEYQLAATFDSRISILRSLLGKMFTINNALMDRASNPSKAGMIGDTLLNACVEMEALIKQYCGNDDALYDEFITSMGMKGFLDKPDAWAECSDIQHNLKELLSIQEEQRKEIAGNTPIEDLKKEYISQYKAVYGEENVPEYLNEVITDAKMTAGMTKLAIVVIITSLITKQINSALAAGAAGEATGTLATTLRTFANAHPKLFAEAMRMFSVGSTILTDTGLEVLNAALSENGLTQEKWDFIKEAEIGNAAFMGFAAYIASPIAHKLSQVPGAKNLFKGGQVVANDAAMTTTQINGAELAKNMFKTNSSFWSMASEFGLEVGMFTGFEALTSDVEIAEAATNQTEMLSKIKIMNHFIEYMIGARAHVKSQQLKLDAAINNSKLRDYTFEEIKNPNKTQYKVICPNGETKIISYKQLLSLVNRSVQTEMTGESVPDGLPGWDEFAKDVDAKIAKNGKISCLEILKMGIGETDATFKFDDKEISIAEILKDNAALSSIEITKVDGKFEIRDDNTKVSVNTFDEVIAFCNKKLNAQTLIKMLGLPSSENAAPAVETEEVAPFAQHLTRTPSVEDLTIPEIKEVTLENGEFNEQGEFIPDGTKVVTEAGNPLAKSKTYKIYNDGDRKVAQTFDEFTEQICEMMGLKKLDKSNTQRLKRFFDKNPEVTIADVSECINDYIHITGENKVSFSYNGLDFGGWSFGSVKDFQAFKAKINAYDKFISNLDPESRVYKNALNIAKNSRFSENLSEITPEEFQRNIEFFNSLDEKLQEENLQEILFKQHDENFVERMNIANDFNKFVREHFKENVPTNILFSGIYNTSKDSNIFRQNIELAKELITDGIDANYNSRLINNIVCSENNKFVDLTNLLKTELGENFNVETLRAFMRINRQASVQDMDFPLAIAKIMPEGFKTLDWQLERINDLYERADNAGKQEMMNRLTIISKMPQLVSSRGMLNAGAMSEFLTTQEIKSSDKIVKFLELAEPGFLQKIIKEPKNSSEKFEFNNVFAPENLDNLIRCAELHKELPEEFKEYLHSQESRVGNEQNRYLTEDIFNFQYQVDANILAKRIEIINQYKDKMSPKLLESIYNGRLDASAQTIDMLSMLEPDVANMMISYSGFPLFKSFDTAEVETLEKFANFVNNAKASPEDMRDFINQHDYSSYNILDLFAQLTPEELDSISFKVLSRVNLRNILFIKDIKDNIASTPKRIRDLIKDNVSVSFYFEEKYGSEVERYKEKIAEVEKLSDEDLQSLGSKIIAKYLVDKYSDAKPFNKNNVEVWRSISQEVKDKLDEYALIILNGNDISLETINARVEKLKKQGVYEKISSAHFKDILINTSPEMEKCLDEILSDPSYDRNNINVLISKLVDLKNSEVKDWGLINELIKNPNVKNEDISELLSPLRSNREEIYNQQKEFLMYLLGRGDIECGTISKLLDTFETYGEDCIQKNQILTDLAKEFLDNKNTNNEDAASFLLNFDLRMNIGIQRRLYTKLYEEGKFSLQEIAKIVSSIPNHYSFAETPIEKYQLAEKLLFKYKLPTDITSEILNNLEVTEASWQKVEGFLSELIEDATFPQDLLPKAVTGLSGTDKAITTKFDFIKEMRSKQTCSDDDILSLVCYSRKHPEIQLDLARHLLNQNVDMISLKKLVDILNNQTTISPDIIANKILELSSAKVEPSLIIEICTNAKSISIFNTEVIEMITRLSKEDMNTSQVISLISGQEMPQKLPAKIEMLLNLSKFTVEDKQLLKRQGVDIETKITALMNAIDTKYPVVSTSKAGIHDFLKHIGNNRGVDEVIQNANFEQLGKTGIPLQYSRDEFMHNMDKIIAEYHSGGKILDTSTAVIPELKLTEQDRIATQEKIKELKANHQTEDVEVIMNGETLHGTRFIGTQGGSNKAYYTQIGDKLYYIKYPTKEKLGQSVEEVMASRLYRAAGIDSPNMEYIYNENGQVIGMAGEYVPDLDGKQPAVKDYSGSYAADAWLANWDAPKNDNTQSRATNIVKVDVGGSMHYRARGEQKDFGNVVNEINSLIEQNSKFMSMSKDELLASIERVTSVSDEQIYKIIEEAPSNDANLARTLVKRKEFLAIFAKNLKLLHETDFKNILDMVNEAKSMTIEEFRDEADIAGMLGYTRTKTDFEGLLNTKRPEKSDLTPEQLEFADRMIAEIEKFTKGNRIADDVEIAPEVRDFLNSILKGVPEFAPFFGKPQHGTQKYSLDIHILKVLQDSLNDPLYKNLSDTDKIVLKFSTLLHDIGKRYLVEGSDTGHALKSAEYVYSILDKFNFTPEVKDRIITIVNNHHWFKDYNTGNLNPRTVAAMCRHEGDFNIYQIMAKADLKNVNDTFYKNVLGVSTNEEADAVFAAKMAQIAPYVEHLAGKQVVITPSKFVEVPERVTQSGRVLAAREFPTETITLNGVDTKLKTLNLTKLDENTDMFRYGFNHILLKDLRLFVHMLNSRSDMDVFKTLAQNPMNESAQSLSMISMADKSTYSGREFGFVLDVNNENIGHAYFSNTGSGTKKGFGEFTKELFENSKHRDFVRVKFKEYMDSKGVELSIQEYSAIAKYIAKMQYPETQIKNLKVGDRVFSRKDILGAFTYSRDQLIEIKQQKTHGEHNEIVGLNSKVRAVIAKVKNLSECPDWVLEFAKDNNLPIILIGY